MDCRGVLMAVAALGAGLLALATSCSAPDPGEITFKERPKIAGDPTSGGTAPAPTGVSSSSGGTDGGAADAAPVHAFSGAPAYVAADPAGNTTIAPVHPGGNPGGQNCQTCHTQGGSAPAFAMAGTVLSAPTGGSPVAKAEVRMVDPAGTQLASVHTDANGNFWIAAIPNGIPAGAKVGVRNGSAQKLMSTALAAPGDGSCLKGGCHVTGAQGQIFLN